MPPAKGKPNPNGGTYHLFLKDVDGGVVVPAWALWIRGQYHRVTGWGAEGKKEQSPPLHLPQMGGEGTQTSQQRMGEGPAKKKKARQRRRKHAHFFGWAPNPSSSSQLTSAPPSEPLMCSHPPNPPRPDPNTLRQNDPKRPMTTTLRRFESELLTFFGTKNRRAPTRTQNSLACSGALSRAAEQGWEGGGEGEGGKEAHLF